MEDNVIHLADYRLQSAIDSSAEGAQIPSVAARIENFDAKRVEEVVVSELPRHDAIEMRRLMGNFSVARARVGTNHLTKK